MATISIKNANHPAPKWFRKLKKSTFVLTAAANVMVVQYGFTNELLVTKIQLWCTIGIASIFEALEICLKDDGEDAQPEIKPNE